MYVEVAGARVPIRPLWRAFILSFLTGSAYQAWWVAIAGRDLARLGTGSIARAVAWVTCIVAGELAVILVAAAGRLGTPTGYCLLSAGVLAAVWAIADIAETITATRQVTNAPTGGGPNSIVAVLLMLVGFVIAGLGVQPHDHLGSNERIITALTSGLVLPFWLLYLQHALNQALLPLGPKLEGEQHFGGLASPRLAASTAVRDRVHSYDRQREMSEQMDILPLSVLGLIAGCTVIWAWQMAQFGIEMSLTDMRDAGAATRTLVQDGQAWRLVSQNFLHFSVDHWAFNMFATCLAGWMAERVLGHRRMLIVIAGAATGCTALAWWGSPVLYGPAADGVVSAGESGIAFGMIGALVAIDPEARGPIGRFGRWMAVIGAINSLAPGVGLLAHAGGFIGGYLVTHVLMRGDGDTAATTPDEPPSDVAEGAPPLPPVVPAPAAPTVVPPPVLPIDFAHPTGDVSRSPGGHRHP